MFDFAENTKEMTASEILNYYRNLYYAEPQVTERGIVANAINDILSQYTKQQTKIEELSNVAFTNKYCFIFPPLGCFSGAYPTFYLFFNIWKSSSNPCFNIFRNF